MCTEWAGLKAKLIWGSFSDRCDDTLDPTVARHIFKYLRIVYCGNVPVLQQLNAARLTAESVCMYICMYVCVYVCLIRTYKIIGQSSRP
jgi:hypothetical protein